MFESFLRNVMGAQTATGARATAVAG